MLKYTCIMSFSLLLMIGASCSTVGPEKSSQSLQPERRQERVYHALDEIHIPQFEIQDQSIEYTVQILNRYAQDYKIYVNGSPRKTNVVLVEALNTDQTGNRIVLYLQDISLMDALQVVCMKAGLAYQQKGNIVYVGRQGSFQQNNESPP